MAWRLACVHVLLQMHALTLVPSPRVVFVVRVVQREERVFRTKYCYQDISGEGRGKKQATAVRLTCGCFPSFVCCAYLCRHGLVFSAAGLGHIPPTSYPTPSLSPTRPFHVTRWLRRLLWTTTARPGPCPSKSSTTAPGTLGECVWVCAGLRVEAIDASFCGPRLCVLGVDACACVLCRYTMVKRADVAGLRSTGAKH